MQAQPGISVADAVGIGMVAVDIGMVTVMVAGDDLSVPCLISK